MATVHFKCSTQVNHSTNVNAIAPLKNSSFNTYSISKLGDSMLQFASTTNNQKKKTKLNFPSKDLSNGDSSIEFHEKKHNNIERPISQSEDDNKINRFCKTNELSISSIYEEEKRSKLTINSNFKNRIKNPIKKSEFKSFKKYTYKALNQPEEVNKNHNILDNISDSDDTLNENKQKSKEAKVQPTTADPVEPEQNEDESNMECDSADEDIGNKMTQYQSKTIPNAQFSKGNINYRNLLTNYYNDDIETLPLGKIDEMEQNLKEIDLYRKSIEESKVLIQKLKNQLEVQTTTNPMNQSSLHYSGKLPDEDYLLCELNELKNRYNSKTEKFKTIVQKLKTAITKSASTSPSNDQI